MADREPYSPIPELNRLRKLQKRLGFEGYAAGFGLTKFDRKKDLSLGWSSQPEFLDRLIPFAQANGTGSVFALWRVDGRQPAELPVVVLGDEGGYHVVARSVHELLQLLAVDSDLYVDWDAAYVDVDGREDPSDGHEEYLAWLRKHFDLGPPEDPNAAIAAAQAEYGHAFTTWADGFLGERRLG